MSKGGQDHSGKTYRDSGTKLVETHELYIDRYGPSTGLNQAFQMWETALKLELCVRFPEVGPGSVHGA